MSRPGPTSLHNFDHGFRSQILFTQPAQLAVCACWATFFRRHAGILQLTCTHSSRGSAERTIIDLFNNTAAILSLLDLRSIMGCPGGGTRSLFTRAFRAKRGLQCIFLGKKAIVIAAKDGTMIFFSHYTFFQENLTKSARKYEIVLTPPWASHNTP